MPHQTALLATIAASLALAFAFGFAATRLKLPPLVGYLLAGVAVGPFTPGYVADASLASQLADVGVILLMFGVGIHFSFGDLLKVRRIVVPGAIVQIALATALGAIVARSWGWSWPAGIVFGLSLSVASTVVLLRGLEERSEMDSADGRLAVGWLIVQDLAMVLVLVLIPALAPPTGDSTAALSTGALLIAIAVTLLKVAAFVALMLFVGVRAVPWLLARVARTGSRELFTLSVLAVALGIAVGAAALFGVSFALGAFFAGVVISESDLSHQAAADALPLQDAFAVLFFVSVGMLFDPKVLLARPLAVFATVLIVLIGQSLVAFVVALFFRRSVRTALTLAAGLGQIGEFSFILAGLGISVGILPPEARSFVLAGAIILILFNPALFGLTNRVELWLNGRPRVQTALERAARRDTVETKIPGDLPGALMGHAVIVGYGRVGSTIGKALTRKKIPFIVVEQNRETVESLRKRGITALYGDATRSGVLKHAHLSSAQILVVTAPDAYQARRVIELGRAENASIQTVVRTHSVAEQIHFMKMGVGLAVMGERELALGMARFSLRALGVPEGDADRTVETMNAETGGNQGLGA